MSKSSNLVAECELIFLCGEFGGVDLFYFHDDSIGLCNHCIQFSRLLLKRFKIMDEKFIKGEVKYVYCVSKFVDSRFF